MYLATSRNPAVFSSQMRRLLLALTTAIAVLGPTGVASAAPPDITNSRATSALGTSAVLKATVDPSTTQTAVTVEYGTSTSYGTPATCSPPIPDVLANTPAEVTCSFAGLTPNTTYHARFVADGEGSAVNGPDIAFVAGPQVATTGAATSITSSSATLNGTTTPNGVQTNVLFNWGPTTGLGRLTTTVDAGSGLTAFNLTAPITGLAPYTRIYFQTRSNRPTETAGFVSGAVNSFVTDRALTGITAKASRVTYDGTSTISGTVSGAGTSGVNLNVEAQPYPYDQPFAKVLEGKSASNGTYSLRLGKNKKNTKIRVVTSGSSIVASQPVTLYVATRVGLTIKKKGSKRVFTGTVRPKLGSGARAKLQRKSGKKWVTVRTLKLTTQSSASSRYTTTLSRRKKTSYRVQVSAGTQSYATGVSTTRKVK